MDFLIKLFAGLYLLVSGYYFLVLSADFIEHKGFFAYFLLGELIVSLQALVWPLQLL